METDQQNPQSQPSNQTTSSSQVSDFSTEARPPAVPDTQTQTPNSDQQAKTQPTNVEIPKSSSNRKVFIILAIILVLLIAIGAVVYFYIIPHIPKPAPAAPY